MNLLPALLFSSATIALAAAAAAAEPPLHVLGLHSDMTLTQARNRAEALGGTCGELRRDTGRTVIHLACDYIPCAEQPDAAGRCRRSDSAASTLQLAGQPVIRIGLEAPGKQDAVSRITLLFDGDLAAVANDLGARFGPPDNAGEPQGKSWTRSQRLRWSRDGYRLGLLDEPHLVILVADPARQAATPASGQPSSGQ